MNKYLSILSLALLLAATARAQPLAELLAEVQNRHPELRALEQDYAAALERPAQVDALPHPEIGVGFAPWPIETRLGPQRFRFGLTQMFPWPGTRDARADLARREASRYPEQRRAAALELSYQLKTAYYALYGLRAKQLLIDRQLELLEALRRLALARVESGRGRAADVLFVDLRIREWEQEKAILREREDQPRATINQLLQRPLPTPVVVPDSLPFAPLPFDQDTLAAYLGQWHPRLRENRQQQAIAQGALALNELERRPTFGIGADYLQVGERGDANPSGNGRDVLQLRAMVSVPLFQEQYRAREREHQLRLAALESRREDALTRLETALEHAFTEHETADLRRQLYTEQLTIIASASQLLRAEYRAGGDTMRDLLELEQERLRYATFLLEASVQSWQARAAVERVVGDL